MNARRILFGAALCGAVTACATAAAFATSMRNHVLSSGGMIAPRATNGLHQMVSTLGQPAIGNATGSNHSVRLGFWCFGARVVGVDPSGGAIPHEIALGPAFPNPARNTVRFVVALPVAANVRLEVFDISGRRVGEPVERAVEAGYGSLAWEAPANHAGIYFARVFAGTRLIGRRRIVLMD